MRLGSARGWAERLCLVLALAGTTRADDPPTPPPPEVPPPAPETPPVPPEAPPVPPEAPPVPPEAPPVPPETPPVPPEAPQVPPDAPPAPPPAPADPSAPAPVPLPPGAPPPPGPEAPAAPQPPAAPAAPPAPAAEPPAAPPIDLALLREALRTALARATPPEAVTAIEALVHGAVALDTKESRFDAYVSLRKTLVHREPTVVRAGIAGFGRLKVAKSSRELQRFFDPPNGEVRDWPTAKAAVEAWGEIHDPGTHETLWDLIKVPSHEPARRELAIEAARALAGYKDVPKPQRYALLDDFMTGFRTTFDTGTSLFFPSAAAGQWWASVHHPLVESFNQLVATQHTTYEECEAWWRKHRKEIQSGRR